MLRGASQRSAHRTLTQVSTDSAKSSLVRVEPGNADVKVVVKHTFIEVVAPPGEMRMNRSMSDSALESFQPDTPKPWDSEKPWHKSLVDKFQDMSDASTHVSLDGDAMLKDNCSSDEEVVLDATPPTTPPSTSSGLRANAAEFCPSAAMTSFAPSTWASQSMGFANRGIIEPDHAPQECRTTVMLRNMPNNYTRDMLLELVDSMGFACTYDFAYLPVDFKSQAGLGYAFINFTSSVQAKRCFDLFEGFSDWRVYSEKVCTVAWGSPCQGLAANVERYQNSPVMHHSVPDEWKPVLFERGFRVAFPPPTKPMKAPKVRQNPSAN